MFTINGTDFGIDQSKSRLELTISESGDAVISAEVYGDKLRYNELTEDDPSPWSWTLYPPHFYMRSFPARAGRTKGTFTVAVTVDDLDDYEAAIYLMQHNDVDQVQVTADAQSFRASGVVFLSGQPQPFSILFTRQEP